MSDSDGEYLQNNSSDDARNHNVSGSRKQAAGTRKPQPRRRDGADPNISRGKERARWEGTIQYTVTNQASTSANTAEDLNRLVEARKRARY
jgi:hypothetical protein